jgi:pimeloyl-ACP methyl ester carboxylesterase
MSLPGESLRRVLLRISAVIIALLTILAALLAGILAPYYLSVRVAQTSLLTLLAIVTFAAIAWLGMRLCATLWRTNSPALFASISCGLLTVAFFVTLYSLVLRPMPLHYAETILPDGEQYWQLPTGSKIAYREYDPPAGVAPRPEPIVFIHGGPGMRFGPFDSDIYGGFAADGFRVVLYDQAGSGASGLFPHIREYSIARAVEDLEAIRVQLRAERIILIGHSWGSTLAASYIAKYPTHVSKVVFHSPGPIWHVENYPFDYSRTDEGKQSIPPLRLIAAMYLLQQNPDAADNLLPQRQAEELTIPLQVEYASAMVCKGNSNNIPPLITSVASRPDNPALNPYITERLWDQTETDQGDPHTALRGNRIPAILLVGECNYIPWSAAVDYRRTFANLKIFYIPKAGHYIQFEQPELISKVIRGFLLDQPDAIPPYTDDSDPSPHAN